MLELNRSPGCLTPDLCFSPLAMTEVTRKTELQVGCLTVTEVSQPSLPLLKAAEPVG